MRKRKKYGRSGHVNKSMQRKKYKKTNVCTKGKNERNKNGISPTYVQNPATNMRI